MRSGIEIEHLNSWLSILTWFELHSAIIPGKDREKGKRTIFSPQVGILYVRLY